jgi:hypothetical protein
VFTKLRWFLFLMLIAATASAIEAEVNTESDRVTTLLNEIDDMWRGQSSYAVTTMQVKTAHYTRTMKMKAWSKGKEKISEKMESGLVIKQSSNQLIFSFKL